MYRRFILPIFAVLVLADGAMAQIDPASVTDGNVYLLENVGADVPDDSANNNTANLIGSPQVVDGLNGKALQFDGVDDGVFIPDAATINLSTHTNHTVVAVFKCDDVTKTEKQCVYDEGGTTRGISIYVHEGLVYAGGWDLSDYTPEWTGTFISAPISSNQWVAIAAVLRDSGPAQEDGKFEMWMNGNLIGVGPGGQLQSRSNDCAIGYANSQTKYHDGNLTGGGSYFEGAVDEVWIINRALSEVELKQWSAKPWPYAFGPDPADGAYHEDTWVNLTWKASKLAASHDVYLSDIFEDVNSGAEVAFQGNQPTTEFIAGFPGTPYPEGLVPGTTYYWRIDEVNDAEPNSPWVGSVWSFLIPPYTAYAPIPADDAESVPLDVTFSWAGGFAAKLHTTYFGDNFDDVNNASGGPLLADLTFTPTGPLELAKTYYWRVDEFNPPFTYKGDVWSFRTEGTAANPNPAKGETDVSPTPILTWTAGNLAASHEVYFGADAGAVANATTASPEYKGTKALGAESYETGKLDMETTYYWRIDEVNSTQAGSPWIGNLWNFTTGDFLVVDDFESYNDIDPPDPASNRIFESWIDGFGTTDNGALVGNDLPPYAEQTIVHGGNQSMPYFYDNNLKTSEATLTLVYPRDWTEEGVTKLSLWFRGTTSNAADRIYVALNGTAVVYYDDPAATQRTGWNQWVVDLTAFTGVNLTNVNTITIGIGTKGSPAAGGTGTMHFDDIRLIR